MSLTFRPSFVCFFITTVERMMVDIVLMFALYGLSYHLAYRVRSHNQGFRPSDPSIAKPLVLPLTISFRQIIYSSSLGVAFILYAIESFRTNDWTRGRIVKTHLYGWLIATNICVYVKAVVGRLRPNFLAMNNIQLTQENYPEYDKFSLDHPIPDPKGKIAKVLEMESRKSFFSGHACLGSYAATSVILYLQENFANPQSTDNLLILPTLQTMIAMIGLFPGITQGRTYWHHWDDVICGYFVGTSVGLFIFFLI